jgi:molybdate transport system substrate-binding protein
LLYLLFGYAAETAPFWYHNLVMQTPTLTAQIKGISSMATKTALAALTKSYEAKTGAVVSALSIGGVDATRRIVAGEAFDLVFLATDAIDKLIATGHVQHDSRVDWVKSPVAVAIAAGAAPIDISSEAAVRAAVIAAPSISYSTGPSGVYLASLFERWGISESVKTKLVVAAPGVPVGSLIASGLVAFGFQQLTELLDVPDIQILGNLPEEIACITTFSSGITTASLPSNTAAARAFQAYLVSPEVESIKHEQGMYWLTT